MRGGMDGPDNRMSSMTRQQTIISVLKNILVYGVLFVITAYGNSFAVVRYAVVWIAGAAVLVGFFHRKRLAQGVYGYITPFMLILMVAQVINSQPFWVYEALALLAGFALGLAIRRSITIMKSKQLIKNNKE